MDLFGIAAHRGGILTFESNGNWGVLFPLHGRPAYKIGEQSVVTSALVSVAAGYVVSDGV